MNGRDPRAPREEALRQLVRDARAEPAPELDWSALEERLLRQAGRAAPPAKRSPSPWAWGALAVAAAAALWLAGARAHPSIAQAPESLIEASAPSLRDGDALAPGSRLEAEAHEVSVTHAGRATWTLARNSSALLVGRDERITVHLEQGSVLSRVVPNPKPETFVIEAAGARIAVHGTVFSVALKGGHVIVQVREGVVAVGALGSSPAFLLKAPANGDFAADGRSGSINGRPVSENDAHQPGPQKAPPRSLGAPTASSQLAPVASAELRVEPSINDIETGVARIVDATSDCFTRYTQSVDGVQITVHTALSLRILDSGSVDAVDFDPPLSPDAEACAAAGISQVRFVASKQGAKVTRMLELKK